MAAAPTKSPFNRSGITLSDKEFIKQTKQGYNPEIQKQKIYENLLLDPAAYVAESRKSYDAVVEAAAVAYEESLKTAKTYPHMTLDKMDEFANKQSKAEFDKAYELHKLRFPIDLDESFAKTWGTKKAT